MLELDNIQCTLDLYRFNFFGRPLFKYEKRGTDNNIVLYDSKIQGNNLVVNNIAIYVLYFKTEITYQLSCEFLRLKINPRKSNFVL